MHKKLHGLIVLIMHFPGGHPRHCERSEASTACLPQLMRPA